MDLRTVYSTPELSRYFQCGHLPFARLHTGPNTSLLKQAAHEVIIGGGWPFHLHAHASVMVTKDDVNPVGGWKAVFRFAFFEFGQPDSRLDYLLRSALAADGPHIIRRYLQVGLSQ